MTCDSNIFQAVRVIDVVLLGPAMIKGGSQIRGPLGLFLQAAGVATMVFNGLTFWDIQNGNN